MRVHKLNSVLLLSLAVLTLAGGPAMAAGTELCKTQCISKKSEVMGKHQCCPMARVKVQVPQKLATACADCYERTSIPGERAQAQPNSAEPSSFSEREIALPQQKPAPVFPISSPLRHSGSHSIAITLHRILV